MLNLDPSKLSLYISTPIIAAFIGWVTTYLAIKMLFRPRKPIRFLFFTLQGLVPKRQLDLARNIAETVERDLISHKDVQDVLQSESVVQQISASIDQQIDQFMEKLLGVIPMVGMFLAGEVGHQVKSLIGSQFKENIPALLDQLMSKVETELDFKKIIQNKVMSFDLGKLEEIIYNIAAKELRAIELLCGLLGFVVGLAQVAVMIFV